MKGKFKQGSSSSGGAFYGLGFVGSLIYFIGAANGFWMGVLGFLKAVVWPAIFAYEIFSYIGA